MATFGRYLFSISRGITSNKLSQGCFNVQVVRTLFSSESLGLDNYIKVRQRVITQFADMSEIFRSKMEQSVEPNPNHMVFTEDLKNMLHLVEPGNKRDMDLVINMIKQYNKQHKELRFGSFTFGPVIMRMFHFLNEPSLALETFKNPELSVLFGQISSFHVCLDLLYNNGRYQDILDCFEIIKHKQMQGATYPKHVIVLVCVACYKMNTPESLKYALQLWKECLQFGHKPLRRAATSVAALALNQNFPEIALEIVSEVGQPKYITVRCIQMVALAEIGRPEDTFPILRTLLESDAGNEAVLKNTVTHEVLEKIRVSVATSGNQSSIREFEELEKNLLLNGNITKDVSLDELLSSEVQAHPRPVKGHIQQITEASYSRKGSQKSSFNRPGLRELF